MPRVIARAEQILAERVENPPPMEALARELGVAYSHFRREFKTRTGLPPKQYLLRLRLEKARRLLGNTPDPVKTIADQLGFNSPFHLSAAFKKEFGISPAHWRRAGVVR
jgi:AraC-like DNA-binding protein